MSRVVTDRRRQNLMRLGYWPVLAVVVLGVAASVVLCSVMVSGGQAEYRNVFKARADELSEDIEDCLQGYELALHSGQGFFAASQTVTADEWETFIAGIDLEHEFPGLLGMAYLHHARLDHPDELAQAIERMEAGPLNVRPADADLEHQDDMAVIFFHEPYARHSKFLGIDVAVFPQPREAMWRAARTGRVTMTAPRRLLQSVPDHPGVVLYAPVYKKKMPLDTAQQRVAAIQGWIGGPIELDHFMHSKITGSWEGMDIHIFAGSQPDHEHIIFDTDNHLADISDGSMGAADDLLHMSHVDFGGQTWTLVVRDVSDGFAGAGRVRGHWTLGIGLIVTALLAGMTWSLVRTGQTANRLAMRMTDSLRTSEERFALTVAGSNDGLWDWVDVNGDEEWWSDRFYELLGYEPGEIPSTVTQFKKLLHPDDVADTFQAVQEHFTNDKRFDIHYRLRTKIGQYRWFHARASVVRDEDGNPVRMAGIISDIHEQRTRQDELRRSTELLDSTQSIGHIGGWELDVHTRELYWTAEVYRIHEVDENFVPTVEKGISFYTTESQPIIAQAVERAIVHQDPYDVELQIITAKGNTVWIRSIGEPTVVDGQTVRITGTFQDITEQKRTEDSLKDSERFARSTVNALSAHIAILDYDGTILAVNRAWNEFATKNDGMSRLLAEGTNYLRVCESASGARAQEASAAAAGIRKVITGEADEFTLEYPCHSPEKNCWFLLRATRFIGPGAQRVVVAHEDVTERKEYQLRIERQAEDLAAAKDELESRAAALAVQTEELETAQLAAEEASLAKSEFLANMSHEIRTPMTAILGYTDLLIDPQTPQEDTRSHAAIIKRNGVHLLTLINDILDLSKIEAGKMSLEQIDTRPDVIVQDVLSLMAVRAQDKGLRLSANLITPIPSTIKSDPVRLRQILVNIVGNAIKFTNSGSVTIDVTHDTSQAEHATLCFAITDTGIGMNDDHREKLFQPFSQADTSTARKYGGSGLGLTISRRLAHMLGGTLTLETELNKGSTFTLSITCIAAADAGLVHSLDDEPHATTAGEEPPCRTYTHEPLAGVEILLAEDGLDNQKLLSFHLTKAGARVRIAHNGRAAIETFAQAERDNTPFDLVLMDMQMPEMDGYQATASLRKQGCTLPIIALTAHAMSSDRAKCLEAGCDDYASKPINRDELISMCARWIKEAAARSAA